MAFLLANETWMLLATAVFLFCYYIHWRFQLFSRMNIPHDPPGFMGINSLLYLMSNSDGLLFKDHVKRKKRLGLIYGNFTFLQPSITVQDPEILKQIYIKEFNTFPDRTKSFLKMNGKEMNTSLVSVSGHQWKRIRTTLSPTFSASKLKEMFGIVEMCADKMMSNFERCVVDGDGRFELKKVLGRFSMDVICSAAFSGDVHSQDGGVDAQPKIVRMARKMFDTPLTRNLAFLSVGCLPWLEKVYEKLDYSTLPRDARQYFTGLVDALIRNKKTAEQNTRTDLMQMMLEQEIPENEAASASKGMTRNEIVGNSMIMMMAGYETTANALVFLAYNLGTHPHVQDRLRREIQQVSKHHGGLTYDALTEMKYLMMCINESLRLYPQVAINARFCEEDITINGVHLPKGFPINIPVYGLSHDEEYWDEPMTYNPDRMEDMSKIDPMVFQPFGGGPRNCIGMRLALVEIKLAICKLLLGFELTPAHDTPKPPAEMTFTSAMNPKYPMFMKVRRLSA